MKTKNKIAKKGSRTSPPKIVAAVVPQLSSAEASLSLDVKAHGLEPILGAAYLMMDRAFVSLAGDRAKKIVVVLRAKEPNAVV